ncbi:histidinol-phosphatase [Gorillibacterium timonense]|uniref:histidinol-phosphatase n=1 Tax=Gorillibacterium timonense TaxID=1689269 RepID=UPI00071E4025|nr:histidinol-phosphatase [Gorillibacterium timonense]
MKFDMHTHHERCGHADNQIRAYIESAIEKGFDVIGISDHSPYFSREEDQPEPLIAMAKSQFTSYISEVLKLKEEYRGKIDVLLGVESDYYPRFADIYREAFAPYPFDYIIGSVHQTSNKVSIFNRTRWRGLSEFEKVQAKDDYYRLIRQSAESGMFQILGHIDAMKGNYPEFSAIPFKALEETLAAIGDTGVAIEINTSGKTKLSGGWYPSDEILERALYYRIPITFGSDAHTPSRVGDEFEQVQQKLREIGFKEWVYFKQKVMQRVPL